MDEGDEMKKAGKTNHGGKCVSGCMKIGTERRRVRIVSITLIYSVIFIEAGLLLYAIQFIKNHKNQRDISYQLSNDELIQLFNIIMINMDGPVLLGFLF